MINLILQNNIYHMALINLTFIPESDIVKNVNIKKTVE
jgi:hypothetical protein